MINDNGYYITLCKDNKNYYINLRNRDYFTREKLESILNSIIAPIFFLLSYV